MSRRWKENPPGEEQIQLNNLFEEKKINKFTKPSDIYSSNECFRKFTLDIFRQHFNRTKKKYTTLLEMNSEENSYEIPEIAGNSSKNQFREKNHQLKVNNNEQYLQYSNYPIMRYRTKDPVTKQDKVIVTIPLISGVEDVRFEIDEDGETATVKFNWPKICYNPARLFQLSKKDDVFPEYHPIVINLEEELQKFRSKIDEIPTSEIKISLPAKVSKNKQNIKRTGVIGDNGEKLVVAELLCETNYYNETVDETVVKFA